MLAYLWLVYTQGVLSHWCILDVVGDFALHSGSEKGILSLQVDQGELNGHVVERVEQQALTALSSPYAAPVSDVTLTSDLVCALGCIDRGTRCPCKSRASSEG